MGEEENFTMGSKKKSKLAEMSFDAGDDEPIGSLLKLKRKKIPKKGKIGLDGGAYKSKGVEIEDAVGKLAGQGNEDVGGMDDTLASFRKKLRGPKKDARSALQGGKNSSKDFNELSPVSLNEHVNNEELRTNVTSAENGMMCDGGSGGSVNKVVEGTKRKRRRFQAASALIRMAHDSESDGILLNEMTGDSNLQTGKDVSVVPGHGSVDETDDTLSALLRKAQSGLVKKSCNSLELKQEMEAEVLEDGLNLSSEFEAPGGSLTDMHMKLDGASDSAVVEPLDCTEGLSRDFFQNTVNDCPLPVYEPLDCTLSVCEPAFGVSSYKDDLKSSSNENPGNFFQEELRVPKTSTKSENFRDIPVGDNVHTTVICNDQNVLSYDCLTSHALSLHHKIHTSPVEEVAASCLGSESLNIPCEEASHRNMKDTSGGSIMPLEFPTKDSSACTEKNEDVTTGEGLYPDQCKGDVKQLEADQSNDFVVPVELASSGCDARGENQDGLPEGQSHASESCEKRDESRDTLPLASVDLNNNNEAPVPLKQPDKIVPNADVNNSISEILATDRSASSIKKCTTVNEYQSFDAISNDARLRIVEDISGDEEAGVASSPSNMPDQDGTNAEDTECLPDIGNRGSRLAGQRALRKAKKRRHGDMAYEGDADWEILVQGQDFWVNHQVDGGDSPSKIREKLNSSSVMISEAENVAAAAVSVGLKARAAGPAEKMKFKEVLKRKGGLQEYLECRNRILCLWNKDVSRILPLSGCGIPTTSVDEAPRDSLVRDVYAFLDQYGYINFGVASEKGQIENGADCNLKVMVEKDFEAKSGALISHSEDGMIKGVKSSEAMLEKSDELRGYGKSMVKAETDGIPPDCPVSDSIISELECSTTDDHKGHCCDAKLLDGTVNLDCSSSVPCKYGNSMTHLKARPDLFLSEKADISTTVPAVSSDLPRSSSAAPLAPSDDDTLPVLNKSEARGKVIVVGAGPAGLTAARHLQRQGLHVIVLEARSRLGGRVFTDRSSLSVPVDLGASIITGVQADVDTERRPDPSSLVCAQLGLELTVLNSDCPLYDIVTGQKVPADLDEALESEYNSLLDDMVLVVAQKGEQAMRMSLEDGLEYALNRRRLAHCERINLGSRLHNSLDRAVRSEKFHGNNEVPQDHCSKEEMLSPLERRVMDWHYAHLEYGCAALLEEVSLPYWNQDDVYGGFGGAHCMIKGGYSTVVESLAKGLQIHLNQAVTEISYAEGSAVNHNLSSKVSVSTSNGMEFSGDAVLVTVPLGCLKAETIKFSPPLPQWKNLSIQQLGFGVLNKVVLEFPRVFWDNSIDYFGATAEERDQRGHCFMFWNLEKTVGAPVLVALVVGKAAIDGQNLTSCDHVSHALAVLRKLFGDDMVPDPVASVVTDWGRDPYSFGAYSYVAVGSSGEDYDILGRPIENCLFFAGEATCKEHPDTVGGAMMSGLREAVRIIDILYTGHDYTAEVETMEAVTRHSDLERCEIRDIIKRLDAVELSKTPALNREGLLRDMFFSAKTTSGRLHLAKELLKLPVQTLKSFAGTKGGLSTLNSWILDSMGKNGTQLLRHCVRLLVLVSTDLLAVRLSGIGKTVKEKVCVHTSRDIRAIASQLVSVWIEIFRKEKVSNGRIKLLRRTAVTDSSRSKSNATSAKPPLRTSQSVVDSKRNLSISSLRDKFSVSRDKKVNSKSKSELGTDSKSEAKTSSSQGSVGKDIDVGDKGNCFPISDEERAAIAAAEAAHAAALAAAQAYASGTKCNAPAQLPKIPSFHKFARREQYAHMDEPDVRRNWSGSALGRQDCLSEIDSRNCRVRDWPVDFSAACINLGSSKMSVDNRSQRSHSNEIACHFNFKEHSGESVAVDSSIYTKAWVDSSGSVGIRDYNAIERWQYQAAVANSDFYNQTEHIRDEEESNMNVKLPPHKHEDQAQGASVSKVTENKELYYDQPRGADRIKQTVVDYVASLLMPLYKARKIDRDGYKSIMKKTATKVMEQTTDAEKAMAVPEFLDFKRKNKIRDFVDKLIERHMEAKPVTKT